MKIPKILQGCTVKRLVSWVFFHAQRTSWLWRRWQTRNSESWGCDYCAWRREQSWEMAAGGHCESVPGLGWSRTCSKTSNRKVLPWKTCTTPLSNRTIVRQPERDAGDLKLKPWGVRGVQNPLTQAHYSVPPVLRRMPENEKWHSQQKKRHFLMSWKKFFQVSRAPNQNMLLISRKLMSKLVAKITSMRTEETADGSKVLLRA